MTNALAPLLGSELLTTAFSFSLIDTLVCLFSALILGGLIALTYKKTFTGVMYSSTYAITLIAMTMVSTLILMVVTSNVALTLGMVGALSIIRFRTAIKEPLDVMYMFWAVACGIVIGAGLIGMAVIGSLCIACVLVLLFNRKRIGTTPYVLVVRMRNSEAENLVMDIVTPLLKRQQVKSKTVTADGIELTLDVRLRDNNTDFVTKLSNTEGVSSAALVTYNGEYMA